MSEFTKEQVDAAVKEAVDKTAAKFQADLEKANKTNEALAAKVKEFEDKKKADEGKTDELLQAARVEIETLKGQITVLTEVQTLYHADIDARWKATAAELAKTDKGKAALKDVFAEAKTPEQAKANLDLFGRLQASGMFEGAKGKTSPGNDKTNKTADDETATPVQRLAGVFAKQSGEN